MHFKLSMHSLLARKAILSIFSVILLGTGVPKNVYGMTTIENCTNLLSELSKERALKDKIKDVLKTEEKERTEKDMEPVFKFKNESENPFPQVLDLDRASLEEESAHYYDLIAYEEKVLFLKKGDSIKSDGKTIPLGEFLGAGNATHIFAHRDNPKLAVRIPFYVFESSLLEARILMGLQYEKREKIPKEIPRIQIYEISRHYSYMIVDRVNGHLDGKTFLENPPHPITDEWHARSQRLRELASIHQIDLSSRNILNYARQYLWDESANDWVLVDWE